MKSLAAAIGSVAVLWLALAFIGAPNLEAGSNTPAQSYKVYSAAAQVSPTPTCAPSWTIVSSPNVTLPGRNVLENRLSGVSAVAPDDVWAVGSYLIEGTSQRKSDLRDPTESAIRDTQKDHSPTYHEVYRTLIMHWNGTQWDIIPSPNAGEDDNQLFMVDALAANDVWAAGYYLNEFGIAQTLTMRWNGTAWTVVPSPNNSNLQENVLYSIAARAADDAWAVGYYTDENGVLLTLTMRWNGTAWTVVPSPSPGEEYNNLRDLTIVSATEVWAVGSYYNDLDIARSLTMRWNGAAWSVVASPNVGSGSNILTSVDASAADNIWAVGGYSTNYSGARGLAMRWTGATWTVYPTPGGSGGYGFSVLYGVDTLSPTEAWSVGFSSELGQQTLTLKWNGAQWSQERVYGAPEFFYGTLYSVEAINGTDVWAVGTSGSYSSGATLTQHYSTACITCPVRFTDVPESNPFFHSIQCLACQGIVGGYTLYPSPIPTGSPQPTGTPTPFPVEFRPNNPLTRGQLAKIVSNSIGATEDPGLPIFQDVYPYDTYYLYVNRLARRGVMSGYPCGTRPEEPCSYGNLPYFRPNAHATRGQIAKIISNAAGYSEPHTTQMFQDVPLSDPFYIYIARLTTRGIVSGYPCGGLGEPCVPPANLPYFRPNAEATRGQTTKMAAKAYFPNCYVP